LAPVRRLARHEKTEGRCTKGAINHQGALNHRGVLFLQGARNPRDHVAFTCSVILDRGIAPAAMAQGTAASQADTQAIKAAHEKFSEAWNKHDAAAIAALCVADTVF
jgi:hypothetical protein